MAPPAFRVELDAVYFSSSDPKFDGGGARLAPILDMSPHYRPDSKFVRFSRRPLRDRVDPMEDQMASHVSQTIHNGLSKLPQSHRGEVCPPGGDPILSQYQEWKANSNMRAVDEDITPANQGVGVTVESPIMYATEPSFREVEAVSNLLRATCRAAVPISCRLRVIVSAASEKPPLLTLKRMTAICWASDQILQQMHPVSCYHERFYKGPRETTDLAQGEEAEQLGADAMTWQGISIQEYINKAQPKRLSTKFDRVLSRDTYNAILCDMDQNLNNIFHFNDDLYDHRRDSERSSEATKGPDILNGAIQLLNCRDNDAVSCFMRRNFDKEYCYYPRFDGSQEEGCLRPTVDFTKASGSLDGYWVSTHAKICVGVVRFAADAADGNLWRLIYDCHVANADPARYDIFDLLLDLGLAKEAETVQRRA
ncbi:hypothetical protein F4811DRAFT_222372 [Daldinia bambusicola]|nr:hypothetical protein F4811DRAFT_222372 [Daldinia bambusicola]